MPIEYTYMEQTEEGVFKSTKYIIIFIISLKSQVNIVAMAMVYMFVCPSVESIEARTTKSDGNISYYCTYGT